MTDTVLVTGGLGYIGGRVALALAASQEWNLRLTTRRPGPPPGILANKAEVVSLDLTSRADFERVCQGIRYVVHLAGANEIDASRDPQQALVTHGAGTLRLLEAVHRAGVERFLYLSTAHVYGAPLGGTITEQTLPRPTDPYAIAHRTAEDLVLAAHHERKIQGLVLRSSNVLGPPVHVDVNRWTLIVNDLCRQAVTKKALALRTDGLQWRDFITLSDVGSAVAHFLKLPTSACGDGLFNLGGESPLRVIDLAQRIANRCKKALGFIPSIHVPTSPVGETFTSLDYRIDKLKASGFTLMRNIDQEIDETLWFCRKSFG